MSSSPVNRSRKIMLLMLFVFVLPVILAKLALEQDWFNKGSTNKGQLLTPTLSISALLHELPPKWRLAYVLPTDCKDTCENAIYAIQQVWLALGREQDRAEPLLITSDETRVPNTLVDDRAIRIVVTSEQNVKEMFNPVGADGIFIVDTQANVVLKYPLEQQKQQAVLNSRDILSDLKKLLKLSRIG